MSQKRVALMLLVSMLMSSLTYVSAAHAGELKIIDNIGIIRLMRNIEKPVEVRVEVGVKEGAPAIEAPVLASLDRIESDLIGKAEEPHTYRFSGVAEGTWQLKLSENSQGVRSLTVLQ